jgi:hypothetical protein
MLSVRHESDIAMNAYRSQYAALCNFIRGKRSSLKMGTVFSFESRIFVVITQQNIIQVIILFFLNNIMAGGK